jgi:hypothetical protein
MRPIGLSSAARRTRVVVVVAPDDVGGRAGYPVPARNACRTARIAQRSAAVAWSDGVVSWRSAVRLLVPSALLLLGGAACAAPGFAPDEPPGDGPSLVLAADVDGARAAVTVVGAGLGDLFGLSAHVALDGDLVRADGLAIAPFLGDDAPVFAAMGAFDVALGAARPSVAAGERAVDDGEIASFVVDARTAGTSRLELRDAVGRRADGSFVPLAVAGGAITLEAP